MRIKGVKTLYFSGAGTFPNFLRNLSCYPRPNSLPRERQLMSCVPTVHSCAFLLMVLFLWSIITD